jgi:peptidoglycan/xylan/chitin deacetylase (PgdA/CDA1 family)
MVRVLFFSEVIGKVSAVLLWILKPWSPLGAVLFFGPDIFLLYQWLVPSGQWLCQVFTRFDTERDEVWLTIDDGPDSEDTPRILDLLDRHAARATFFLVGERVARWPHLVPEILRRGHEVGHHTHTHPAGTFWCASRTRLSRELDDTLAVLRSVGARPIRFRPPVGIKNFFLASALKARGLHCVGWTVRSGDCLARRAEDVVERVMPQIRPGAILLLHEGASVPPQVRVKAISLLLESLTAQRFRCVVPHLNQLRSRAKQNPRLTFNRGQPRGANPASVGD